MFMSNGKLFWDSHVWPQRSCGGGARKHVCGRSGGRHHGAASTACTTMETTPVSTAVGPDRMVSPILTSPEAVDTLTYAQPQVDAAGLLLRQGVAHPVWKQKGAAGR